ncbi:MAG: hypothetical protein Q4F22_03370, partial [Phascolarctobacterium sp.]|nr:hypothetical protein [Phascolarctobacterium sp.]
LGVRVAKLEKGADAVKITGQIRMRYQDHDDKYVGGDKADLRTRLWVTGQINDDWTYTGMLESTQNISDNAGNDTVELNRAYLNGKLGGMDVQVGRWDEVTASGAVYDTWLDGIKVAYGKDVKVFALAGKGADSYTGLDINCESNDRVYIVGAETKVGPVDVFANWFRAEGVLATVDQEVYDIGLGMDVAKDLRLTFEYMWGDKNYVKKYAGVDGVSKDGYIVGLNYKGADASVPGTYGVHAFYYDQPVNAFISPTFDLTNFAAQGGYEGWSAGVDYTLAKNIQLCVNYYDTEAKVGPAEDQAIFSELYFFF